MQIPELLRLFPIFERIWGCFKRYFDGLNHLVQWINETLVLLSYFFKFIFDIY